MKEDAVIGDYILITPSGERRDIGENLPEDLDTLGIGKLLAFPVGTDAATKDRFVGYASRHFWSSKRFKAAGVQLHALQSASRRSLAVDIAGALGRTFSRGALLAMASVVILGAGLSLCWTTTRSAETISAFDKSFLVFATETYNTDEKVLKDIEKSKLDMKRFKEWRKEAEHAE